MNRRGFFKVGAGAAGGLLIGIYLPEKSRLAADIASPSKLNTYVHIGSDDTITFTIVKSEMGQGTLTSLSQILAEELDCEWKNIKTEIPSPEPQFGMMGAFGSLSVRTTYNTLRQAGAGARAMLIQAAAQKWGVDASQCRTEKGAVVNTATNASLRYGSLADAAAKLPAPKGAALKDPKSFKLIGTSVKRIDTPDKISGRAKFGIDTRIDGMLYAVLARCPVFGGKVAAFDATKAKAVPGVKQVVQISNGVAVLADNTWNAMEGRKALQIQWDEGPNATQTSAKIRQTFMDLTAKPGAVARKVGDADQALAEAAKKIEAVYEAPFLSHSPMEPMNCTAQVRADSCEVWAPTQIQTAAQQTAMAITKLPAGKIIIHTTFLGGGFGRRGGADFVAEAVEISKAAGVPVKLTWSREDDMQHDLYRPASYAKFAGGVDANGNLTAFTCRVASQPFAGLNNGVDRNAVDGIANLGYGSGIPNILVDNHPTETGIPCTYWRSVGYSHNTFFTESFIDELANAAGKDPVEFRRTLLAKNPRMLGVLNLAAEKAGWGKPLPTGHYHGIGLTDNIGSFNAQVAEVSVTNGKLKVHKVTCAIDCGVVVNPAIVEQQVQSGIVFGLGPVLRQAITIERGRVMQANFNNYDPLRIDEMPVVEVHIVPSMANPGGIGEATTPNISPAIANAVFKATGKRIRHLPIRQQDLV
ncbi:MAG TPA: xanthine dehydrogenase family protein molybdopterin-binding subunit [Bryobacteraceae bacterium]|jgi:isoquinoline 1-oxidoreductase beta subunit